MINPNVLNALREQINKEFASAYLYLSMSLKMESANYKGFANWLFKQYQEELEHAHTFIHYIQKRGAEVQLNDIKAAEITTNAPLAIAEAVLAHEQMISHSINSLTELSRKENDYATEIFLHDFINEQIEEEDTAQDIVAKFTFAGDSAAARYSVDQELARR